MVSSVTGSAGFSAAMLSGSQCRGSRGAESQQADKAALQEKLFSKLDVNGDGGVDESELNDFLSYASSATGSTAATGSAELFDSIDSDGDGNISKTEMSDGVKSLFDELRTQLMSKNGEAGSPPLPPSEDSQEQDPSGSFMDQTKPRDPPPAGGPGSGGRFSMIQSLLDQYRSTSNDSSTEPVTSTLAVAA